ncbi:MAG: hypothetical protein MJZ38_04165 [archaeon]|nr:hypothetical protein [archaeon]
MFAVIACLECRRKRIIDKGDKSSKCPYCGARSEHKVHRIYYQSDDPAMCRAALNQITGFTENEVKKPISEDIDPYSTLEYRYDHCHTLEEKMTCLSEGLTKVYGEFTFEDLERIEPKNAEKMLKAMLVHGYVHETKYGRYSA